VRGMGGEGVYEAITAEIQAVIDRGPRGTQKRLAAAANLTSSAFRHRMGEYRGERFSFEEIEAVRLEVGAPLGWPYLTLVEAEACAAFKKMLLAQGGATRR
jgi:hypothetical protein